MTGVQTCALPISLTQELQHLFIFDRTLHITVISTSKVLGPPPSFNCFMKHFVRGCNMNLVNRFTVFNITRQTRLVTVHPNLVRTPTGEPLGPHRVSRGRISSGTSLARSNVTGVTETPFNSKSARCGHFSYSSLNFTLLSGTFKRSTTRTLCASNLVPKSFN